MRLIGFVLILLPGTTAARSRLAWKVSPPKMAGHNAVAFQIEANIARLAARGTQPPPK